jgi:hypothetical protein
VRVVGAPVVGSRCGGVLLALWLVASSCDQSFRFDIPSNATSSSDAGSIGAPGRCVGDPDCVLESLHCDRSSELCVECVVDEDCAGPASRRCDTGLHRCVECEIDRDCASGSTCDTATHRCFATCAVRQDCAASAHACDVRRHVCIACDDDRECGAAVSGGYCSADGISCVECRVDANCALGSACDVLSGHCVECRDTRDCAAGSVCDPATHTCT